MSTKRINLLVDTAKLLLIVVISFLIVAAIIFTASEEPLNALYNFFVGPWLSIRRIGNMVEGATPLIFTALAVMIIFGSGQFSMISEGSFFVGATVAMVLSIAVPLPAGIHPIVCILGAALAGAFIASIPAILKVKWDVSEVVTSIMMNYIVQFFALYLVTNQFREKQSSVVASLKLAETSIIPNVLDGTNIHAGVVGVLLLCVGCWFLIYRSGFGYRLRVTGCNAAFAHYAGMKELSVILGAQLLAGAIAGAGGAVELLGMYTRFKWTASPGYGWTGIVVALLARNNPLLIPLAAGFIAYINTGANIMAMNSDVSNDVALIIQGVIMLLIASGAMLQRWRQKLIVEAAKQEEVKG